MTEAMLGPVVLGVDGEGNPLWRDRLDTVRHLIGEAERRGRADDIEVLLWRSLLGFWLLRAGQYAESVHTFDVSIASWQSRLVASDRLLSDLGALRAAAALGLALKTPGATAEEIRGLASAVADLRGRGLPENIRETLDDVLDMMPAQLP